MFEVEQWEQEEGGVEIGRAVRAGVAAKGRIETSGGDFGADGVSLDPPPSQLSAGGAMGAGDANGPVEGEPAHELGVDVVGTIAPDLPDTGVGFAPAVCDFVGEATHCSPRLGVKMMSGID